MAEPGKIVNYFGRYEWTIPDINNKIQGIGSMDIGMDSNWVTLNLLVNLPPTLSSENFSIPEGIMNENHQFQIDLYSTSNSYIHLFLRALNPEKSMNVNFNFKIRQFFGSDLAYTHRATRFSNETPINSPSSF